MYMARSLVIEPFEVFFLKKSAPNNTVKRFKALPFKRKTEVL